MRYMKDNTPVIIGGRGNRAYVLTTAPIYDEWVRSAQDKHRVKEVITRRKKRDDVTHSRFIKKKINRSTNNIAQTCATITNLQVQFSTY
ncbi:unnamed protein product [Rotaria magnacalcarata]|uniref:Uncharacterized protein n=1 Tax=Rotaria magnacalcarata TaxID=392030 RepID=A0A819UGR5_9BILA|nr:unnamed protein product [Rotaria magnacalcarata]